MRFNRLQSLRRFNEFNEVKKVKRVKRVKEPLRDDNTFKYVYETNEQATEVIHICVYRIRLSMYIYY